MTDPKKAPRLRITAAGFRDRVARPGAADAHETHVTEKDATIELRSGALVIRWKDAQKLDTRHLTVPLSNVAWIHEQPEETTT